MMEGSRAEAGTAVAQRRRAGDGGTVRSERNVAEQDSVPHWLRGSVRRISARPGAIIRSGSGTNRSVATIEGNERDEGGKEGNSVSIRLSGD